MLSGLLAAALVIVFALVQFFPFLGQQPYSLVTNFFLASNVVQLAIHVLVVLIFVTKLEEKIGSINLAIAYLVPAAVANMGIPTIGAVDTAVLGSGGGILGLLGVVAAVNPYAIVFEVGFPVPAFVAVLFVVGVKFLLEGSTEAIPLLIGLMLGYLWKGSPEKSRAGYTRYR